jgi:Tfp pilus assembly protein PilN
MPVNLLPPAIHQQLVLRRTLRQWAPLWCVVAVAFAVYLALSWWELTVEEQSLAQLERELAPWSTMQAEMVESLRRVGAAQKQREEWKEAEEHTVALPLLVVLSESVEAARGEVQVQQCQVAASDGPAPSTAPGRPGPKPAKAAVSGRNVSLGGLATSDASLMDFVKSLKERGKFKRVEITSLAASSRGPGLREWRLDCTL